MKEKEEHERQMKELQRQQGKTSNNLSNQAEYGRRLAKGEYTFDNQGRPMVVKKANPHKMPEIKTEASYDVSAKVMPVTCASLGRDIEPTLLNNTTSSLRGGVTLASRQNTNEALQSNQTIHNSLINSTHRVPSRDNDENKNTVNLAQSHSSLFEKRDQKGNGIRIRPLTANQKVK